MTLEQEVILHIPLVSAIVWLANGLWPWIRGLRTSPEKAFVAASLLLGLWAFLDWVFLHTRDADLALLVSKVRITVFALAWLAFFYFGRWLTRTRSWIDYLAILPVLGSIAISWTVLTSHVDVSSWYPIVRRDRALYAVFLAQTAAYIALAFGYIGWDLRRATFSSKATRYKLTAIFLALVLTMIAWLSTNAYNNLFATGGYPALSSILVIPGILVLVFLAPESTENLLAILRRLSVTPSRAFAAMWFHNSGQPLAQVVLPGEAAPDAATLADLTRAVEQVLAAGTATVRQLRDGGQSFLFEKGHHLTLVVLVRGNPSEGLRSELRNTVRGFEERHGDRLTTWESASTRAEEALDTLEGVLGSRVG
jgi:hypothetical protein